MKNRKVRAAIACGLIMTTLLGNSVIGLAADNTVQKEENVYATLAHDGSVEGIYVVNGYEINQPTTISDFGEYTTVKNLTTDALLEVKEGMVTTDVAQGKFYYQGNLASKEMPWKVAITYRLDGEAMSAEQLAGKTGELKISLSIKQNKSVTNTFFEHYMMQVSLSLDTSICKNIVAEGATIANVGEEKQLLYNILPGNEKEIEIRCEVEDFTMGQISFKGIDSSIDLSSSQIDMGELTSETSKIVDAAKAMDAATGQLEEGVTALSDGSTKILEALELLEEKGTPMKEGSAKIREALNLLNEEVGKVSIKKEELAQLVPASSRIKNGIDGIYEGIVTLNSAMDYKAMNHMIWNSIAKNSNGKVTIEKKQQLENVICSEQMVAQVKALPASELKTALLSYITAAQSYVAIEEAYQTGIKTYVSSMKGSIEAKTGTAYLSEVAKQLSDNYGEFHAQIVQLEALLGGVYDQFTVLKTAIDTLAKEYAIFDEGLTSYAKAISTVLEGYGKIDTGIASLQEGTKELKEGTQEFLKETGGIDQKIEEKVDATVDSMTNNEFERVSFVSDKNKNIGAVQFVMVTEEITKPVQEKVEQVEESKSFLTKLIDLFR